MINKDSIVNNTNILNIKSDLYCELYDSFIETDTLNYFNIEKFGYFDLGLHIHPNVNSFLGSLCNLYNKKNNTNVLSYPRYKTIVLINRKNHYIGNFNIYNIRVLEEFPEGLVGFIFLGNCLRSMVFGKILTEKESKSLNIIK